MNVRAAADSIQPHYDLAERESQPPASRSLQTVTKEGFRFLSVALPHQGELRWAPREASRLWAYQLHAFSYLSDLDARRARETVIDWIDRNPPADGAGWEPYTISLRVREWIEWLLEQSSLDQALRGKAIQSIASQVAALEAQIEHHLLANHLLENAITLCWAGLSLIGPRAASWRALGLRLLRREIDEQVLSDGSHYERSPMYQSLMTEALLRLSAVAGSCAASHHDTIARIARDAGTRLLRSLAYLVHPDNEFALLGDTALGVAPTANALMQRFRVPVPPSLGDWQLSRAGYYGLNTPSTYLVFDAGDIGPSYQPGHGHADLLSFELSHLGTRLIADTGIYTYDEGPVRAQDRSTAAHNTITLDGADQAELWGSFRCGRRPRIRRAGTQVRGTPVGKKALRLIGGYRGPSGRFRSVAHSRVLEISPGELCCTDNVCAQGDHEAIERLHLGPDVRAHREGSTIRLSAFGRPLGRFLARDQAWKVGRSVYHPSFGVEVERACLFVERSFRHSARSGWVIELA